MTEAILKMKNFVWTKKSRGLDIAALRSLKIEILNTVMILSVFFLMAFYLFVANNVTMASYNKTVIQKNIDSLRIEIRDLNLELTSKRSIGFLMTAAQGLKLVINEGIQYIKIVGPVAKNP